MARDLPAGPRPSAPGPFFRFDNLENTQQIAGVEFSIEQLLFDDALKLWGNGTWQRQLYDEPLVYANPGFYDSILTQQRLFTFYGDLGRQFSEPPPWKFNIGADFNMKGWYASAVYRYVRHRFAWSQADTNWISGLPTLSTETIDGYSALRPDGRLYAPPLGRRCDVQGEHDERLRR